ncbi:MAG: glycosyltransferase family 4 protein [Verrucomicrobia bacterium]|nr:glycosyltransferase family 4 protein [Verrucomicrobiota bacterium]
MHRPRVLRIFNRYQQYGGEEKMVRQIGNALAGVVSATTFEHSSDELLAGSFKKRIQAPFKVIHNRQVFDRLTALQHEYRFDAWEIHNTFPAFSPAVYDAALELGVRVVQYLHNYRFSCVNGMFLNQGEPCYRCIRGTFWAAFRTACWRSNRWASGIAGIALNRARRLFSSINIWVAISEAQKRRHIEMGIPAERIRVVPHFLDAPTDVRPNVPEQGYFLFLGRLSAEKGLWQLLQGWRLLRAGTAKLVIAGDGPERTRLENLCRGHGLKNVEFRGYVAVRDQDTLWQGARALIVPSIWEEPFGLVVLEAWAHGRPALVSNRGGLPEIVTDSAARFSPDQPEDIAAILDRCCTNSQELRRIASEGLERLRQNYNRAVWLNRINEVYREALAG